ncbi:DUF58 domain-containing protein [Microbacterium sp. LRZ72]|uniref:DUF58 domain-containing protein n=1 Tax=Microbacterium sp. LRZ72 TaxID=2942481 RepID=UPI0029B526C9|nr:DUF58 domain-containing protein [Microbacterium sp. LRZ72]MDX2376878.1 DUF58 domain-containing protein [Microbacterium sp. LRZ72]
MVALACFAFAGELGTIELLYVGCLLVAVLIAGLVLLRLARGADDVARTLQPDVVPTGGTTRVRLHARAGRGAGAVRPRWSDTLPPGVEGVALAAAAEAGGSARGGSTNDGLAAVYDARAVRRGIHTIGPATLQVTDPFGLARRTMLFGATGRLVAVPATVPLAPLPSGAAEAGGLQHSASDDLGQGNDNLIARPYAPGDSMRRIHWRATAHRDELMVRQEEQESAPAATVVLDLSGPRWDEAAGLLPGTDPAFEAAVGACASIALRLAKDGCVVSVRDSDGTPLCDPLTGADAAGGVTAMLFRLATVHARARDALPALADLFAGEHTGPVVVLTGRVEDADADRLLTLAHHSTFPVLLSAVAAASAVVGLREAGWHCAPLGETHDLSEAWAAATERGVHRAAA